MIIAHENVLKRMETVKDAPKKGLPTNTYFEPWIITYQFKKMADGSKWNPTPCAAK